MTVAELIEKLQAMPANMKVAFLDPDTGWMLPVQLEKLEQVGKVPTDFVVITSHYGVGYESDYIAP